jgi:hypothetical protein
MAVDKSDKHILFSVGFDPQKLDKELKNFAKQFQATLKSSFKSFKLDFKDLGPLKVKVELDFTDAEKKMEAFQRKAAKLPVAVVPAKEAPKAAKTVFNIDNADVNPGKVKETRKAIDDLRNSLRHMGLAEKDVQTETQKLETRLNSVSNALRDLDQKQRAFKAVTGKEYIITDADVLRIGKAAQQLDDVNAELREFNTLSAKAQAKAHGQMREAARFVQGFAFNVGILGFGLQTVGQRLIQVSQALFQITQTAATAIEPLQRIKNLLSQDTSLTNVQRTTIIDEVNRLADIPGSKLESVADGFRLLNSIGLETAQTLQILEGLIKVTGRSGVGAEGVTRLANQFRQFASSREFRVQDIKAITESGGKDLTDILVKAFGSLEPEAIEAAGPEAFFKVLIEGLASVPEPLATATDKINIMTNSLIRMAENISQIVMPGFDSLIGMLKSLEPVVASVTERFNALSPAAKDFISTLIVTLPVVATAVGTVLVGLGTLAIGISTIRQLQRGWNAATVILARNAGVAATEFTALGAASNALIRPFAFIVDFLNTVRAVGIGPVLKSAAFSLNSLAGGLARILGLTTPIGLFLNVLIGYLSNAGGSRDNINSAVLQLWDSLKNLGATLSEFAEGALGRAIITTLNAIINMISGTLANALGLLILQLAKAVDLLNSFFGLLNSPAQSESWANFITNLVDAFIGWMPRLGAILGATIADVLADIIDNLPIGLRIGGSGGIRNFAQNQRNKAFNSSLGDLFDPFATAGKTGALSWADNLKKADQEISNMTAEVDKLNTVLKQTDKISKDIRESFFDLGTRLAKVTSDLRLAQIKFNLAQKQKQVSEDLDRQIKADPTSAQVRIPEVFRTNVADANDILNQEAAAQIKRFSADVARTQNNLEAVFRTLNKLPGANAEVQKSLDDAAIKLQTTGREIEKFSASGSTNFKVFDALVKKYNEAGAALKGFVPQGEEGTKQLNNLNSAIKESQEPITSLIGVYDTLLKAKQDNVNKGKQEEEQAKRAAAEQQRAVNAAKAAAPLQAQLVELQNETKRLQDDLEATRNREVKDSILERIRANNQQILSLERQIAETSRSEADAVKDVVDNTEQVVEGKKQSFEQTRDELNLLIAYNEELSQSFRAGFNDLDAFKRKLDEINDRRAALGLGSSFRGRSPVNLAAAQLATEVNPILDESLNDFGANAFDGGTPEGVMGTILRALNDGVELSKQLRTSLLEIAGDSGARVVSLTQKILDNETNIAKLRGRIAGLPAGKERDAADADLKALLLIQGRLNQEVNVYINRVRASGAILEGNRKIIAQSLEVQRRAIATAKAELDIRREILEAEAELNSIRIANQERRAAGAGGLGATLDLSGRDALETEQLERQVELINIKYNLQLKELELKRLQLQEDLANDDINQKEYDRQIQLIDARIKLIESTRGEDITGLNLDNANRSLDRFVSTLRELKSIVDANIFKNFAASLKKATDEIPKNFSILASSAQLFKDVFASAFVSAFEAIGQAWVNFLLSGESFAKGFKKFLGDMLISLGTALIQMSLAAVAMAFMQGLFTGGIFAAIAEAAAVAPMAAIGVAVGTALVIAGGLLGGGGGKAVSTSNTSATNAANAQTGATGNGFDPNRDPRTLYQQALAAQVLIDIRTDDGVIVKKVIKAVNSNGRLTNLIGNRKLGFGY